MTYQLRAAIRADQAALQRLIARSARELGAQDYRPEQIEGALRGAFGVDTQLIDDGTYFVVESEGKLVGCGGLAAGGHCSAGMRIASVTPGNSTRGSMPPRSAPSSSIRTMHAVASAVRCWSAARARRAPGDFVASS